MKTKIEAIWDVIEENRKFGALKRKYSKDTEMMQEADHMFQDGIRVDDIARLLREAKASKKADDRSLGKGEVAFRNDVFRRKGLGLMLTRGIQEVKGLRLLLEEVRWFKDFTPDNDPHGEHDFGTIDWKGQKVFWKIDYYDQKLEYWCNPLSRDCRRVLTVMLAEEY